VRTGTTTGVRTVSCAVHRPLTATGEDRVDGGGRAAEATQEVEAMIVKAALGGAALVLGIAVGWATSPGTELERVGEIQVVDDDAVRRSDLDDEVTSEEDEDEGDGDRTAGDDGTGGGNNTGDGDRTAGDDGTNGGNNTGDGNRTAGDDGTNGGNNTGDGDGTWGNDGTAGGANTVSYGGGGGGGASASWSGGGSR
jgi:hypothetical protein